MVLLRPLGVEKTNIAVALALESIAWGIQCLLCDLQQMADYLLEGSDALGKRMTIFIRPKLLVIDEVGYLPLNRMAAN